MLRKLGRWILTMVDVKVRLDRDILNIEISLAGVVIADWTIDLIKDTPEVKHGTQQKAR